MDRKTTRRRVGNTNRTTVKTSTAISRRTRRRIGLATRRNRRKGITRTRDRLYRAMKSVNPNRRGPQRRFRRFNFNRRRNLRLRIVFVGGLPTGVDNRRFYSLFRKEGRIVGCKIVFNRMGISKGYGFIEFSNPRDAWRAIQKWNNTTLGGRLITVEYRRRRRNNRQRFGFNGNGYNNRSGINSYNNYNRYNQPRKGFGTLGRGGYRVGSRRGRY